MNIKLNRKHWVLMLTLMPFSIGGWFLTSAGWPVWLAISVTVVLDLAVVFLCEGESSVMRMTGAATAFALPGLMLSSVMICAGVGRWVAAAILLCAYVAFLILAWRGKPRWLMSPGWWSALFALGVAAFALALRYWPDAMSRARWVVEAVRILIGCDWTT